MKKITDRQALILREVADRNSWELNYSKVSRETGIAVSTVWDIVQRLRRPIPKKNNDTIIEAIKDKQNWCIRYSYIAKKLNMSVVTVHDNIRRLGLDKVERPINKSIDELTKGGKNLQGVRTMEIKINVDRLNREQLIQILAIVTEQSDAVVKEQRTTTQVIEEPIEVIVKPRVRHEVTKPVEKSLAGKEVAFAKIRKERPRNMKKYSEDEVSEILKLQKEGKSPAQIARTMKRSPNSIKTLFWRIEHDYQLGKPIKQALAKMKGKGKPFTKTEIQTIWKEHRNGNTIAKIAKLLNRDSNAVYNILYRLNHPEYHSKNMKEVVAGNV